MKFATAAVKRVNRPEKQFLYLSIGQFLKKSGEYDVALDLACGTMPLANQVRAKRYIGVDLNEESLSEGSANHPDAVALHSTIEGIPADTSGDIVLCFQCIGVNRFFQVENTLACVRRMVGATHEGGTLIFNVGPRCRDYFDEIESTLKTAFRGVSITRYGRFYERRSTISAMILAYAMYYFPTLARDESQPRRLYICRSRVRDESSGVQLAA
jgi:hypothetical protein